jgi:hypothetical protein
MLIPAAIQSGFAVNCLGTDHLQQTMASAAAGNQDGDPQDIDR